MSSVKRRIIIEEYVNDGFGIFDFNEQESKEVMGLSNWEEVEKELKKLKEKKHEIQ